MKFAYTLLIACLLSCNQTSKQEKQFEGNNSRSIDLDYGFKVDFLESEVFDNFITLWNTRIYHNDSLVYSDSLTEFEVIDNSTYPSVRMISNNRFELLLIVNDRPSIEKLKLIILKNNRIEKNELIPLFIKKPMDIDTDGKLEFGGIMTYYELVGENDDIMPYVPILVYEYNDWGIELDSLETERTNIRIYDQFYGFEYSEKYSFKKSERFESELKKFK